MVLNYLTRAPQFFSHDTIRLCELALTNETRTIWKNSEYLVDYPHRLMMAQLIILILLSQALYLCLRPIGQTKFVCNILAGTIMGPSVLGYIDIYREKFLGPKTDFALFTTISKIGIVYFLFLVSVKYDVTMLRRMTKNAWKISLVSFFVPAIVFSAVIYPIWGVYEGFMDQRFVALFFFTISLSFCYFPVLVHALDELNILTTELGQLALSSSMINDSFQLPISIAFLTSMSGDGLRGVKMIASLIALIAFSVYILRPLMVMVCRKTPEGREINQMFIVSMQIGVLIMAAFTDAIGMRFTAGPIILGLTVPYGELSTTLISKTETLVKEFFLPMFFFQIGAGIDPNSIHTWDSFVEIQTIITIIFTSKFLAVFGAGLLSKLSLRQSLVLSSMLNVRGLLDLIQYNRWYDIGFVGDQLFTQLVLSTVAITMVFTPILRYSHILKLRGGSSLIVPFFRLKIQSMPTGTDMFRILCCVHNEESVPGVINLLELSNPTEESPITAYVVHAMEFVGRTAQLLTPYKGHSSRFTRSNSMTGNLVLAFKNYSKKSNGPVMIKPYSMVAPFKSMHETIARLAQEKNVPLIIIPFHENHQSLVSTNDAGPIRQFNQNVQSFSPCTVGILVDRGITDQVSANMLTINVAVFFIGGPDDREALAFASRMLDNRNVEMKVFRITIRITKMDGRQDDEIEFKLDESLIEEFKLRHLGNDRLVWKDVEVENGVQVMSEISKYQGPYVLAMVGRRHADVSLKDEEMTDFMQNPELGVIGDMLASPDFCDGSLNVLVMQESRDLGIGPFRSDSSKFSDSKSTFTV